MVAVLASEEQTQEDDDLQFILPPREGQYILLAVFF